MDFYLGAINAMAINFAPYGWMTCQGQIVSIQQYAAVFSLIGTNFGGNGTSNFQLPDLQGRMIIGQGHNNATNQTYTVGQKGGTATVTLTVANLPPHNHGQVLLTANSRDNDSGAPKGHIFGSSVNMYSQNPTNATLNAQAASVTTAGSGQPLATLSAYQGMYYNICMSGIFPQRP